MDTPRKSRPSLPLRLALVAAIALAAAGLLLTLLIATDTALSIWQRLREAPLWLIGGVATLFALLLGCSGWLAFRLLRAPRPNARAARPAATRAALEQRIDKIADRAELTHERAELAQLDSRAANAEVYVALFGEISAGKTSLMRALTGRDELPVDVRGGTTRSVLHARGFLPDGRALVLADAPGINEAGDSERAASARAEAVRAHALVFVIDGDVTAAQHAELHALLAFGKPTVIALNKSDRYRAEEIAALVAKLRERYGRRALVVAVAAGGDCEVARFLPDGREERVNRPRAPQITALDVALESLTAPGKAALEPGRQRAVLETLSARLEAEESTLRARDADATVKRYTRRAVIGALAAVAPGTDLLIQGALGAAMLRELAQLYGVSLRDLDVDGFIERAAGTVRTNASLTLMIAGNALKAFPGLGTVGGGLVHALAYGLIFDALGRAVAATLASRPVFDQDAALAQAADMLETPEPGRLKALTQLAANAWRERDESAVD